MIAANGTCIETIRSIYDRTANIKPQYLSFRDDLLGVARKDQFAANQGYAPAISSSSLGGARPPGMGYSFADSWARTQREVMEFSLPVGQVDVINMAMRFSCENAFVYKALKLKTLFSSKGLQNAGSSDKANAYFDSVMRQLYLQRIFRDAMHLYYSVGLVPIVLPKNGKNLDWVQLWDPRFVVTQRAYGRTAMYLKPDPQMYAAIADPNGTTDLQNKNYFDWMPERWRDLLIADRTGGQPLPRIKGSKVIPLDSSEYLVIENRFNTFDRSTDYWDGCPLQAYFTHCENYRMLMAGDFATAFLGKNIIALISVGDPKLEGANYIRPDSQTIQGLVSTFQNPDRMMFVYGDVTHNVRYITPDPKTQENVKYKECKENLKNLLPGPFWYSDTGGSYADATVEMQQLEEECTAAQNDFDEYFWKPLYLRAADGSRIGSKHIRPPVYDRSALRDRIAELKSKADLFEHGGLDIKSLISAHGYDPEVIRQKLIDQIPDVDKQVYKPSFEKSQSIVAATTYGLTPKGTGEGGDGGTGGRPENPASNRKQSEKVTGTVPRPSDNK